MKSKRKLTYKQLATMACELEARVVWALKFLHCQGGGVTGHIDKKGRYVSSGHWKTWFADGAELLGRYKVDRELLFLNAKEQKKVLKQREAEATKKSSSNDGAGAPEQKL
jgi:hypothetical protein